MYKDPAKQKEANRINQQKCKARKKAHKEEKVI